MFHRLKQFGIVRLYLIDKPINILVIRGLLSLLLLLSLAPVWATPTSAIINGLMKQSSDNTAIIKPTFDQAVLMEDIKNKLAATNAELVVMPSEAVSGSPVTGSDGDEDIFIRRLYLRQLVFLYEGQLARLVSLQVHQQQRLLMENQASNWSGFSAPASYPFLRADELKESVTKLSRRVEELKSWASTIELAGTQLINTAENSIVKLRQADEAVEQAKNAPDQQVVLSRARDLVVLQNQIDLARVIGFQIEKQTIIEDLLENRAQLQLVRKQLSVASEHVELTQQDVDQVQKNLEIENQHIISELKQGISAFDLYNNAVQQDKSALNAEAQFQSFEPEQRDQIRQAQRNNVDIKLQALNRILTYLQMQRDIWNLRWAYAKVTDREKASEAYDKIARNQVVLNVVHDYVDQQRHRVLTLVTNQSVEALDPTVSESDALRGILRDLDLEQVVSWSRLLGTIEATQDLLERCKQELDNRFQVKSFYDYLGEVLLETRDFVSRVWAFELFAVQDNIEVDGQIVSGKRSVTVDKVVTALAILIIGYWFAVRLARLIEGLAVTRLDMDASLARIVRRWMLFLEVLLLIVLSMLVVRIPLTIFAFMGGALAIGVGFGMQNMLKNLISGLMLLFERPFRPGDLVEVGGIRGRVIDIGVRSSHIRDGNGIETLIPNSTFIEQNVTNWTLSNEKIRIVVKIGVAYGSPVREVTDLLLEVADKHGVVEDDPKPRVQFEDFGSDALQFGLYVWVELKPDVSWAVVASDLRYMIYRTMNEHGIAIAFPQRDIHLDTSRPLEVRVFKDSPDAGSIKE